MPCLYKYLIIFFFRCSDYPGDRVVTVAEWIPKAVIVEAVTAAVQFVVIFPPCSALFYAGPKYVYCFAPFEEHSSAVVPSFAAAGSSRGCYWVQRFAMLQIFLWAAGFHSFVCWEGTCYLPDFFLLRDSPVSVDSCLKGQHFGYSFVPEAGRCEPDLCLPPCRGDCYPSLPDC